MKKSFFITAFFVLLLISCPPPTPVPEPDKGANESGHETVKEFTVSFDANGGTGTIASMKVKAGTEITLPEASGLSRRYFTFNDWTIFGTGSYQPGDKFIINADTVFTANWLRNRVKIVYSSENEAVSDIEDAADAGSDLILPGNPFTSSPSGKYFYGWTAAAAETDILAPGSLVRVEETKLTFYAYWGDTPVTEYTVTFSGTKMEPITFNQYTKEIRLPLYTGEPGVVCKGWDTNEAAATVVYKDGGTIPQEDLDNNIILYPVAETIQVKLTWIRNGGISPEDTYFFPSQIAPGIFDFYAAMIEKESDDGKLWGISKITAQTSSGQTVTCTPVSASLSVWKILIPQEDTTITLHWEELTQLTVFNLELDDPYDYFSNETIVSFDFAYSANYDPKKENLKITKDGKNIEILSMRSEFISADRKAAFCTFSATAGAGTYLLQIVDKSKVVKEAAFTVVNKGERTFTPTAGTAAKNINGQWVIPVSFVFSNISGPGWLDYKVFLNDAQEELTRDTDYETVVSDANIDFTFFPTVSIQQGDKIQIIFSYDRSTPIQTKSVDITIP